MAKQNNDGKQMSNRKYKHASTTEVNQLHQKHLVLLNGKHANKKIVKNTYCCTSHITLQIDKSSLATSFTLHSNDTDIRN